MEALDMPGDMALFGEADIAEVARAFGTPVVTVRALADLDAAADLISHRDGSALIDVKVGGNECTGPSRHTRRARCSPPIRPRRPPQPRPKSSTWRERPMPQRPYRVGRPRLHTNQPQQDRPDQSSGRAIARMHRERYRAATATRREGKPCAGRSSRSCTERGIRNVTSYGTEVS
jgi:hypothetical protein